MSIDLHTDDLIAVVRYALETTRATAVCPFHGEVIIRVGDDAAESHAIERAKRIMKANLTIRDADALRREMARQLAAAADGQCPRCAAETGRS